VLNCGSLSIKVLATPGHTPACSSILIDDAIFVGDVLFQPDLGCGRCDFEAGSAPLLYESIMNKLYALPNEVRVFVGHDYPKNSNPPRGETSIGLSKKDNIMIPDSITKESFVEQRQIRDKNLSAPALINFALQVNILGGQVPHQSPDGKPFLSMPVRIPMV
jgi:glyoxylase-like metal-dependent hydrolase (beta-lactamase superfamily II)